MTQTALDFHKGQTRWGTLELTIQQAKIFSILYQYKDTDVPLPIILQTGVAQYNARIYELRRRIGPAAWIKSTTRMRDGVRLSSFRLEGDLSRFQL